MNLGGNNKIIITSSTKNLSTVRNFVENKAVELGFDSNIVNQIILSVDEACTNIIKYTHRFNESEKIEVKIDIKDREFRIILKYKGKDFDPNKMHEPDMNEYFNHFRVGGLGIPMMKKFMNKVEYNHKSPNLNSLTLIKNL
jgi:serine/threonine-protein kinase RsbW